MLANKMLALKKQLSANQRILFYIFLLSWSVQSWYEYFIILIIYIKLDGLLEKPF